MADLRSPRRAKLTHDPALLRWAYTDDIRRLFSLTSIAGYTTSGIGGIAIG
jgi:hypothetical protein